MVWQNMTMNIDYDAYIIYYYKFNVKVNVLLNFIIFFIN